MKCKALPVEMDDQRYPGLVHLASQLRRFHEAAGIFTILLQNDNIIHYEPEEPRRFRHWLQRAGIAAVE